MSDKRECEHGPGYICGLCMKPSPARAFEDDRLECGHESSGEACDYDCGHTPSHAGF